MGTMRDAVYAAMLVMFLQRERINAGIVQDVSTVLRAAGHMLPSNEAAFGRKEWLQRQITRVLNEDEWGFTLHWEPPQEGKSGAFADYIVDAKNPDRLGLWDSACLRVFVGTIHMPPIEGPRTSKMVDTFKKVVQVVKPLFALLDVHWENIKPRAGKDPRRFAWGATYYDAEHARAIGEDRLNGCAAVIKEEWPDGSWWIQTWANPFVVAKELTDQIAIDLDLKNAKFPTTLGKRPKAPPRIPGK